MRLRTKPANARERIHTAQTMSATQARRMANGQVESDPLAFVYKSSLADRMKWHALKANEERREQRELERLTGDWW